MIWQIILLSLGILGFGVFVSFCYLLMADDITTSWITSLIIFFIYVALVMFIVMPLGVWKAFELLGY